MGLEKTTVTVIIIVSALQTHHCGCSVFSSFFLFTSLCSPYSSMETGEIDLKLYHNGRMDFPLPSQLGVLGERRKLPQRSPGQSPGRKRFFLSVIIERLSL